MNGIKGWKPSPVERLLAEPLRPDEEPVAIIDEDLMVVQPLDQAIKDLMIYEKEKE